MGMPDDTEAIIRNLARLYAMQGRKREVALLAKSTAKIEETGYDNWNGGTYTYSLSLLAPADLYAALESDVEELEREFLQRLTPLLRGYQNEHLEEVVIAIELAHDENWRDNAINWLQSADSEPGSTTKQFDFFVSHASEDKDDLVRPIAEGLSKKGVRVWYDEFELKVGDGLRESIDKGLAKSKYGIVVLSPSFFAKNWTKYELDGLNTRQMMGEKVILPIWHQVTREEIAAHSPSLADTLAYVSENMSTEDLVNAFDRFLKGDV